MLSIKVALRSMLSLPVLREADAHYMLIFGVLAYFTVIYVVLKTFQYNKTRN